MVNVRAAAICVCYIQNASAAQIGYAVRRLRRKVPDVFVLIALLGGRDPAEDKEQFRKASHADVIETSLEGVRDCLVERARRKKTPASADGNG